MEADAGDDTVTADDVAALNRAAVDRSAVLARIAGAALVAVGGVALLSWLWLTVRSQQLLQDGSFIVVAGGSVSEGGPTMTQRLDVFTNNVADLVLAVLAVGSGAAVRVLADYAQARQGGSITGFEVGDRFTDGGTEESPDA